MKHWLPPLGLLLLTACTPEAPKIGSGGRPQPASDTGSMAAPAATPGPAIPAPEEANRKTSIPKTALIVPGQSIGGTALGESYDAIEARLGRPDASDAAMGSMMATWYAQHKPGGHQTDVFFSRQMGGDETSRAKQLRVTSPWFKTADGLGVGSDRSLLAHYYQLHVQAVYEEAGHRYRTLDSGEGILFEIGPDDRCVGVIVAEHGPGGTPYLSFHPNSKPAN